MDSLSELVEICNSADNDKASERKKSIDRLQILIEKDIILKALDRNSEETSKKLKRTSVIWDDIIRVVCNFLKCEADLLQKAKDWNSAAAINKRKEVGRLFKNVILQALKRSQYVNIDNLVRHILEVLDEENRRKAFGSIVVNVLTKDLLSSPKHRLTLVPHLLDLLNKFLNLLHDPVASIDKETISCVVHLLSSHVAKRCDIRSGKLIAKLEKCLHNIGEHSWLIIEHVLCTCNVLSKAIPDNGRYQLCKMGEKNGNNLIQLWKRRPSEAVKDQLIEFFRFQIMIHHPNGAFDENEGAVIIDCDSWKMNIQFLCDMLVEEIRECSSRCRFAGRKELAQFQLKENLIILLADVCHLSFFWSTATFTLTQPSLTQVGNSAKRQRLTSGWELLRESLLQYKQSLAVVSWLNVVEMLWSRHPMSAPDDEVLKLLDTLYQCLSDMVPIAVSHCLKTLCSVTESVNARLLSSKSDISLEAVRESGIPIWNTVLRLVCSHHGQSMGFRLLRLLCRKVIDKPDKSVWSVFQTSACEPSEESVLFLVNCLVHLNVPELLQLGSFLFYNSKDKEYIFRHQLVDWLFCAQTNGDSLCRVNIVSKISPKRFARILMLLIFRETVPLSKLRSASCRCLSCVQLEETLYNSVEVSNRPPSTVLVQQNSGTKDCVSPTPGHLLESILSAVSRHLHNLSSSLLELPKENAETDEVKQLEAVLYLLLLLVSLLREFQLVGNRNSALEDIVHSILQDIFLLLEYVSKWLADSNRRFTHLLAVLQKLYIAFTTLVGNKTINGTSHNNFLKFIPTQLITQLTQIFLITNDRLIIQSSSSNKTYSAKSNYSSTSSSRTVPADDDFDDSFGTSSMSLTPVLEKSKDLGEIDLDNNDDGGKSVMSECADSLDTLSDKERASLLAVQAMCTLSKILVGNDHVGHSTEQLLRTARSKIFSKIGIEDEAWSPNTNYCICLVKNLHDLFIEEHSNITDDEIYSLVDALRDLSRNNKNDELVCQQLMDMLSNVIKFILSGVKSFSETLLEALEMTAHICTVFRKISNESNFMWKIRLCLAECSFQFLCQNDIISGTNIKPDSLLGDEIYLMMFFDLLSDSDIRVRLAAAELVGRLFSLLTDINLRNESLQLSSRASKSLCFLDKIVNVLESLFTIKGKMSADEQEEEHRNRQMSTLATLTNIALHVTDCEKKAVYIICLMTVKHSFDSNLSIKALNQIAERSFGSDQSRLQKYMDWHLAYIFNSWLSEGQKLMTFPYQLHGFESLQSFAQSYYKSFIPFIIWYSDNQSLEYCAVLLQFGINQLLTTCLSNILIHLLPYSADAETGKNVINDAKGKTAVNKALIFLDSKLSKQTILQGIQNHLEDIVVGLLTTIKFDGDTFENSDSLLMSPNPPYFSQAAIVQAFSYITTLLTGRCQSIISLLNTRQDGLQLVLLALRKILSESCNENELLRRVSLYKVFVDLILQELHPKWSFVMRDIVYAVLFHLQRLSSIKNKSEGISTVQRTAILILVDVLKNISCKVESICPQELISYLPVIYGILLSVSYSYPDLRVQVHKVLDTVCSSSKNIIKDALSSLCYLPGELINSKLQQLQEPLSTEADGLVLAINRVLKATENFDDVYQNFYVTQSLQYLCKLLPQWKHRFGNTSVQPLLKQLTPHLIKLCFVTTDVTMKQAVGLCLGAIGPLENKLSLVKEISLNDSKVAIEKLKDSKVHDMQALYVIFNKLNNYLIDCSTDVIEAASEVLKAVFGTKKSVEFKEEYSRIISGPEGLLQYLQPFMKSDSLFLTPNILSEDKFCSIVDQEALWCPPQNTKSPARWAAELASSLIDSSLVTNDILRQLKPLCLVKLEFAEDVIPYLIHDILLSGSDVCRQILSKWFGHVLISCNGSNRLGQCLLNVVQYLREQSRTFAGKTRTSCSAWDSNFWLDIDYLDAACASASCGNYFASLLFAEIWCNQKRDIRLQMRLGSDKNSELISLSQFEQSPLEEISSIRGASNEKLSTVLLKAYSSIGDYDALYGCGLDSVASSMGRLLIYQQEQQWAKSISTLDLEMNSSSSVNSNVNLLQALKNFGAYHVLEYYMKGCQADQEIMQSREMLEFQSEKAWRLASWDTQFLTDSHPEQWDFNSCICAAVVGLRESNIPAVSKCLELARMCSLQKLPQSVNINGSRVGQNVLAQLKCITDFELLIYSKENSEQLFDVWLKEELNSTTDFSVKELSLAFKCSLLNVLSDNKSLALDRQSRMKQILSSYLETTAHLATMAGQYQISESALYKCQQLENKHQQLFSWQLEEAHMFWARGETDIAKHRMRSLLQLMEKDVENGNSPCHQYPLALRLYGSWLAETKSENPTVIMDLYLSKAVQVVNSGGSYSRSDTSRAYLELARFADAQYQLLVDYMKSSTFESKQMLMNKAKNDARQLRQIGEQKSRYLRTLEIQSQIDEHELINLQQSKLNYLESALKNYLKCLTLDDTCDMRIFRLVSLWFENSVLSDINDLLKKNGLLQIKSFKFLPLLYQLAARIGTQSGGADLFKQLLTALIELLVTDHPHHSLFVILALANAHKDDEDLTSLPYVNETVKATSRRGSSKASTNLSLQKSVAGDDDRILAAQAMLEKLKKKKCAAIVSDMEQLCIAYIQLANWNVEEYKKETKPIKFPGNLLLPKLKNLQNIALPTCDLKVDPSGNYREVIYVKEFQPTFKLAGGINLPKIITCLGSDGIARRQLVKGKDDLRQDAVMQQVFGMVNTLLFSNTETNNCNLRIRTYKVIPLSQRSGLLEWCEGTIPLGEYLVGSDNAHQRYRPQDWKALDCRREMAKVHGNGTDDMKLQAFLDVCHNFKPVFRHFFFEKYPLAADWYQHRLSYIRSVAASSIVGYILGLGDRHVQNILIDLHTAELVHIDLGVAFEQGQILPTPETVPFRLTRDIIDGMGISGVEGVFRRCCEKTMVVMHEAREALLTIVQVLLYDPLYIWTMSPERACKLQQLRSADPDALEPNTAASGINNNDSRNRDNDSEGVNKMAERVLLRLQQKLQGMEEGVLLSIKGQVNQLIQNARDPVRLSRLFPGWQPYI